MLLVSAVDMVMVFLGIEIMSIPIYVLAGFDRRRLRSNESALKYFLVGSLRERGPALRHGAPLRRHRPHRLRGHPRRLERRARSRWLGLGLVLSASPSRSRRCRSTSGRPTSTRARRRRVTAFMSVAVKIAAFAALLRVLTERVPGARRGGARAAALGARRRDDDRRQRDGGDPGQREAHARLLEHRARGLPADRPRRRRRPTPTAALLFYLARLPLHEPRRLRA